MKKDMGISSQTRGKHYPKANGMPMIIVNLKGGLGNQIFQYTLGRKLSLKNNDLLKIDISGLEKANEVGDIYRPYKLDAFNTKATLASEQEVQKLKYPLGFFSKLIRGFNFKILKRHHTDWEPRILKKKGDIYLDGFWQTEKYFADIRPTLLQDFALKEPLSSGAREIERMLNNQSVSIHIRRGDYVTDAHTNSYHGTCSLQYYENAIERIQSSVLNPIWFIFSDDIKWAKDTFSLPGEVEYVSAKNIPDHEELILMSKCAHNIIANSSFSWWGAWLNQNPDKIVVAPTPWVDKHPERHAHIIPDSWKTLPKNPQ